MHIIYNICIYIEFVVHAYNLRERVDVRVIRGAQYSVTIVNIYIYVYINHKRVIRCRYVLRMCQTAIYTCITK